MGYVSIEEIIGIAYKLNHLIGDYYCNTAMTLQIAILLCSTEEPQGHMVGTHQAPSSRSLGIYNSWYLQALKAMHSLADNVFLSTSLLFSYPTSALYRLS